MSDRPSVGTVVFWAAVAAFALLAVWAFLTPERDPYGPSGTEIARHDKTSVYVVCDGPDGVYWTDTGGVAVLPRAAHCTDSEG